MNVKTVGSIRISGASPPFLQTWAMYVKWKNGMAMINWLNMTCFIIFANLGHSTGSLAPG